MSTYRLLNTEQLIIDTAVTDGTGTAFSIVDGTEKFSIASSTITMSGDTGTNIISIQDKLGDALSIKEGENAYLTFDTTDAAEQVNVLKNMNVTGDIAVSGTVDGLDISALDSGLTDLTTAEVNQLKKIDSSEISIAQWGYLGATNQPIASTDAVSFAQVTVDQIDLNDSTITMSGLLTGTNIIEVTDDVADGLSISSGGNDYITIVTTELAEQVNIGQNLDVAGDITVTGTVDGLDISALDSELTGLTAHEIQQLQTIGESTTILDTQWAFLGATDQSVAVADAVAFAQVTVDQMVLNDSTITMSGLLTGTNIIEVTDDVADGLSISSGGNDYITIVTTELAEQVNIGQNLDVAGNVVVSGTVDTGQGATEIYAMNQDVETGDQVQFFTVRSGPGSFALPSLRGVEVNTGIFFTGAKTEITSNGALKFTVQESGVICQSTTDSSSKDIGSLVVEGGVGIEKSLHIGGDITGTLGTVVTGGVATDDDLTLRSTTHATKGSVIVDEVTGSTNTTSGALVVGGGVGIAERLYVGGRLTASNTDTATSGSTGSLQVKGGVGVLLASFFDDTVTIDGDSTAQLLVQTDANVEVLSVNTSDTSATSSTSGALKITGGVGISENLFVGGNLTVEGTTTTINSETLIVEDNVIISNASATPVEDGGMVFCRGPTRVIADTETESGIVDNVAGVTTLIINLEIDQHPDANNKTDYYKGWVISVAGTGSGTATILTSSNVGGGAAIVCTLDTALAAAPIVTDTYKLYNKVYNGMIYDDSEAAIVMYGFPREDTIGVFNPEAGDGSAPSYVNLIANDITAKNDLFADNNATVGGTLTVNGSIAGTFGYDQNIFSINADGAPEDAGYVFFRANANVSTDTAKETGTLEVGSTDTNIVLDSTEAGDGTADYYVGWVIEVPSLGAPNTARISAYDGTNLTLETALVSAPGAVAFNLYNKIHTGIVYDESLDKLGVVGFPDRTRDLLAAGNSTDYSDFIARDVDVTGALDVVGVSTLNQTTVDGDLDINGGAVTIDGTSMSIGATSSGVAVSIGHATSDTTVNDNLFVTGNFDVFGASTLNQTTVDGDLDINGGAVTIDGTSMSIGAASSGVAVSIGHATSDTTVNDNLFVTGNFDVFGASTLNQTTVDGDLDINGGAVTIDGTSMSIGAASSGVAVSIGHSTSDTTVNDNLFVTGNLDVFGASTLNQTTVDGDLDINGGAVTIDGTSMSIGAASSGVAVSIGHATSDTTVNDNLFVTGNFDVTGASTLDTTNVSVSSATALVVDDGSSNVLVVATDTPLITSTAPVKITNTSADTFVVEDASNNELLEINTSSATVDIGSASINAQLRIASDSTTAFIIRDSTFSVDHLVIDTSTDIPNIRIGSNSAPTNNLNLYTTTTGDASLNWEIPTDGVQATINYDNANGLLSIDPTVFNAGLVQLSGGLSHSVSSKEGLALTVLASDYMIKASYTAGGAFAITLPLANAYDGRELIIINVDSADILTINRASTDTIDDGATTSVVLSSQYDKVKLVSDGVGIWYIV